MAIQVYTALAANWDQAITTGVTQLVAGAIQANATLLSSMLSLYIIIFGLMTALGRTGWHDFVFAATRAAAIGSLLTTVYFTQWIQTPAMETIPTWIAQTVNGGNGATGGPQQFDALRNAVVVREAHILQQATGYSNIGERIETAAITWFIIIELTVSFVLWEIARGMMGFLIATAPFLIGFYLFQATRHITMNLAGAAVTILIMQLMLSIMVALELVADNAFMAQAEAPGGGIDVQLDAMLNISAFFLFGLFMTLVIPLIAARIGHGVMPSMVPIVRAPMRLLARAF